jgi:WD40 repeat protein
MESKEKVNFIYAAYDFSGAGELSYDESLLLFRSVAKGLSKTCPGQAEALFGAKTIQDVLDTKIDGIVTSAFDGCLTLEGLQAYSSTHPVTSSWLLYCTHFQGQDLVAPEESVSKIFDDASLCSDITFAPSAYVPTSDYTPPVEETKEEEVTGGASVDGDSKSGSGEGSESKAEEEAKGEDEEKKEGEGEIINLTKPVVKSSKITPWMSKANTFRPEEMPVMRTDNPEDQFSLSWMYGAAGGVGAKDTVVYTKDHNVVYAASNYLVVASMAKAEGEEEAEEGATPSGNWTQKVFREHAYPITAVAADGAKSKYASADTVPVGETEVKRSAKIVVWDATTNYPINAFITASEAGVGVRKMDFSKDGKLLLVLMNDVHNTIHIYEAATGNTVFSVRHGDAEKVSNMCFCGTADMFLVAGSAGATFYVNEGNSFLPATGFSRYERRAGLLGPFSAQLEGASAIQTNACSFEFLDETVTGTANGDILFWHGRNCVQVLKAFAVSDPVNRLSFNPVTKVVAASSGMGKIALFKLSSGSAAPAAGVTKAGPKVPLVRQLETCFTFDLMHLGAAKPEPVALCVHDNGERCLIGTRSGDVYELSLKPKLPAGAEGAEGEDGEAAAPAEGEEPAEGGEAAPVQESKPTYGAILWGGPIATGHFSGGNVASVTGVCAVGTESFVSCGSDGAVRTYECKEGGQNKVLAESMCDSGCVYVTASPTLVAVAMDGSMVSNRLGTVQLLSLPDLKYVSDIKETEEKVSLLRFNPEGSMLLTVTETVKPEKGSTDSFVTYSTIRAYTLIKVEGEAGAEGEPAAEATEKWTLKDSIPPIVGTVNSIDFSADGTFIRIANATNDMLSVFQAGASETVPFGAEIKGDTLKTLGPGYAWATNSCALSWDCIGAFAGFKADYAGLLQEYKDSIAAAPPVTAPPAEGEEDGDAEQKEEETPAPAPEEDEAEPTSGPGFLARLGATARSQHLMLSAGDNGVITVTRVPAFEPLEFEPTVGTNSFSAHQGGISAIAFVGEAGERLITAGAADGLIMVWKVTYDLSEPEVEQEEPEAAEESEETDGKDDDMAAYDSAEEEDLFDGDRMIAHLTAKRVHSKAESAVADWVDFVGRAKEDMIPTGDEVMPNDDLSLNWVYGYSARSTRGAVQYDGEGRIIYPAATLGVVFDKAKSAEQQEAQRYFMGHTDEITALDVHQSLGVAASGTKGCGNITVLVWDTATQQPRQRLDCGEVRGISAVTFSPDGSFVAVACQDDVHTIKLFDWRTGSLRAEIPGGPNKVLNLTFSTAKNGPVRILQGGVEHFRVLEYDGTLGFTSKLGRFGMKKTNINCAVALPLPAEGGNEFLVGLPNGFVALLPLGELTLIGPQPIINGHPVTAMACAVMREATIEEPPVFKIVVGGGDSQIKFIGSELDIVTELKLSRDEFGLVKNANARGFKSISLDKANRKLLYGTSGGEIGEIDFETCADMNEGPLVYSHFKDALRAMQHHPIRQECLTAGEDKTLRVWDLTTHKQMTYVTLPDIAASACYAPNGQIIVVGMGGSVRGDKRTLPRDFDGKLAIVSFLQGVLNIVHIAGDAQDVISAVVFSTDGSRLYAGSGDSNIYVYDALDNFKLFNTLKVHGEGVHSIDLSEDGRYMLSTATDGEIITWDLTSETPTTLDVKTWEATNWAVRSGPRNFNSTGLYPSHESLGVLTASDNSRDYKLVAGADVYGGIKMALAPAVALDAPHKRYVAHSAGGVSKVAFTIGDEYLISTGLDDRCLMQWKVLKSEVEPTRVIHAPREAAVDSDTPLGPFADTFAETAFYVAPESTDTSFLSVKVALESLTGCDHKPRAAYCGLGNVVATCGKKLVAYAQDRLTQEFWNRPCPNDEVGVLTVSSSARFVMVGTKAGENGSGSLCIINASTGKYTSVLSSHVAGGVSCAAFSHDGKTVACVAGDKNSTMSLYTTVKGDWSDATLLWTGESVAALTTFVTFLSGGEYDFVTVTEDGSYKWWKINGRNLQCATYKMAPVRDNNDNMVNVAVTGACGIPGKGILASGNSEGEVLIWTAPATFVVVGQHQPVMPNVSMSSGTASASVSTVAKAVPVGAITVGAGDSFMTGGGNELKIWTPTAAADSEFPYESLKVVDIKAVADATCSNASAFDSLSESLRPTFISADTSGKRVLVGLSSNAIIEVAIDNGTGHVVEEGEIDCSVTAMCTHPTEPYTVVTALPTGVVKVWDMARERREVVGSFPTENKKPSAVTFVNENTIAIGIDRSDTGGKSGSVVLVELGAYEPVADANGGRQRMGVYRKMKATKKVHNIGKGVIQSLKLTPDGKHLAVGSADGSIYLLDTKEYEPAGSFVAISGVPIVAFDFNSDGSYVRAFGPNAPGDNVIKSAYFMLNIGDAVSELAVPLKEEGELGPALAAQWLSTSSPAAYAARGVHPAAIGGAAAGDIADKTKSKLMPAVVSVSVRAGSNVTVASYSNGLVKLFGAPAEATAATSLDYTHANGPVFASFLGNGSLATVGVVDGSIQVFSLTE